MGAQATETTSIEHSHMCESIRAQVFKEKYFENSYWFLARTANHDFFSSLYKKRKTSTNSKPESINQLFNNASK